MKENFFILLIFLGFFITIYGSIVNQDTIIYPKKLNNSIIIDEPGTYMITSDVGTMWNSIIIKSDDVFIDLMGHVFSGSGSIHSLTSGIYWRDCKNISIYNGSIRNFMYGIYGDDSGDRMNRELDLKSSGINIFNVSLDSNKFRGICIHANNSIIQRCSITNTGGTIYYPNAYSMGIEIVGPNAIIKNNSVINTMPVGTGEGVAISLSWKPNNSFVYDNFLSNSKFPDSGSTFAFWVESTTPVTVISNNYATGFTYPYRAFNYSNYKIINNTFDSMMCSVTDYPDCYYDYNYTQDNIFINEIEGCPKSKFCYPF